MSLNQFFRKEVVTETAYHLDEHEGIKLNQNESPWDLPVPLKAKVVEELLKAPWNRYPLGEDLALKKKLAKYLNLWADNLLFANGSNVLIQALVLATSINKKVLIIDPTFSVYEIEANLMGNKVIKVPLDEEFQIPRDRVLKTIKKEKPSIIFIANPNAPTGTLLDYETLKAVIEIASCLVVIDEAYFPYSQTTFIDLVAHYENLVILRTFSKAFSLAGMRLGWLVADAEVTREVEKCLLPFCINRFSYVVANCVLDQPQYLEVQVQTIRKERDRVFKELDALSIVQAFPSKANFILFRVERAQSVFKKLLQEGVIVRQIGGSPSLENTLRVTIGTPEENNAFLLALRKALA